jgi:hypothetical protein
MIEMDINTEHDVWHQWWQNFRDYYIAQGVDMEDENEITRVLQEWRAIELDQESTLFYFENEQDQMLFMLKFS